MQNQLYPVFHEANLGEFNRLLAEAEGFDENEDAQTDEATKDPAQMEEDAVFSKVKQNNEVDVDTNAYTFLGRDETGALGSLNDITNERDPAMKGLTNVISGCILQDSENATEFVTALFNATGANDISKEDFENVSGTIWKKLEDLTALNPVESYSTFKKFILNLVNGIRDNAGSEGNELDEPAQ